MNTLLAMLKFNLKIENIYFKSDKKNLKNFKTKNLIRYAIRIKLKMKQKKFFDCVLR